MAERPSAAFAVCRGLSRRLERMRFARGDPSVNRLLVETLLVQAEAGQSIDAEGASQDLVRAVGLLPRDDSELRARLAEAMERAGMGREAEKLRQRN